jgi:iron complex outermembrane receptor protein
VLGPHDLAASRAGTVAELLETATAVEVSERGAAGVQADLSIRGSTFQQVLTSLDGVPLADSQTAHHNMDLPFPLSALEQVTVIPGPGSALFGPRAFAGVVNLTPRRPTRSGAAALAAFGRFDTWRTEAAVDRVSESAAATLAVSCERSDGFRDGTDYELWSAWGSVFAGDAAAGLRVSAGYADRDFGARDFYAAYPSRERTRTALLDVAPRIEVAPDWGLRAVLRYRRHEDDFILVEDNPSLYRNEHVADTFTERLTLTSPAGRWGRSAVGMERSDAVLDSSNLGDRDAATSSAFVQHRIEGRAGVADLGLRLDAHTDWDAELSPSLAVVVPLGEALTCRASAARGIRPPSFTELYYRDPANEGNADLEPETAWGGEAGLELRLPAASAVSLGGFVRDTENLIDWVRVSEAEPWRAVNIGSAIFRGVEAGLAGRASRVGWHAAYRYTDVDADAGGMDSKYALNVARHDARLTLDMDAWRGFSCSATLRYRDVPALDRSWLLSARVARRLGRVSLFLKGRNLLNERYREIPGVPTAGRYLEAGAAVEF